MKKIILAVIAAIVVGGGIVYATADTKEEKAAKLYASAQELVAKGDSARALIELRNALQSNPDLHDARILFADLLLKAGRRADAFGQYRQAYALNPDDATAARAMASIAFDGMAWNDAREYVQKTLSKTPDDPEMQAIAAGLDYRDGISAKDDDAIAQAVKTESRLLEAHPDLIVARRVLVAERLRQNDPDGALDLVDAGLALLPKDRDLNNTRLVLLERLGRRDEMEQQLLSMVALYPNDEELGRTLVRFYVATGKIDDAEATLRARIKPDSNNIEPRMVLLRFLSEIRSPATMRDELDRVLAQDPLPQDVASNPVAFKALKAQADFSLGDRDQAMSDLEGMIKDAAASAETDRLKVQLARMRLATGNTVGARALVEEVLGHDSTQVDALKMKADWLIAEDQTEPAIALLRDALANAPNDAQAMTLMARAYQREGRPELMSDMLARAVDASNQAPEESLRFAGWLFQQGQYTSAETVLIDALRRQPNNLDLLTLLARSHLAMKDWGRAQQDIDAIGQRFNTQQARDIATELRAQLLAAQGRNDELSSLLEQLSRNPDKALATKMAMVRNIVVSGQVDQALVKAQELAAEYPESAEVTVLIVQLKVALGQLDSAMADLQALTTAQPAFLPGWLMLQGLEMQRGEFDKALATVDAGLATQPDNRNLLLAKAYVLEKKGDIDGAIAIYEDRYKANSDDIVAANNLASLLASTRADQESLERAWTVARRLNGVNVPAFQDTYGWIAFRRGESATALPILEQAAKGLPEDPSVAYHLGQAYAEQRRMDLAKAEYDRADALLSKGIVAYPGLAEDLVRARAALP